MTVVLWWPLAVMLSAQPYLDLIEQYRRGETAVAVATLRSWTQAETAKSVGALMDRRPAGRQLPDVPAMFAAVMLHTEAAFDAIEAQRNSEAGFHLRAAADLLVWTVLKVPDERQWSFARRDWGLMIARILGFSFGWDVYQSMLTPHTWAPIEVRQHRVQERDVIEGDADMALALGSLAEGFAYINAQQLEVDRSGRRDALVRQCRQLADAHFRRALALRSDMVEARLRLGRVLIDEGRTADAEVELHAVLRATTDPRVVYLALLFLGRVAENDHRLEEAIELYRRAVTIKPACQAGRVALAYASECAGRMDTARSSVATFLDRNEPRAVPVDDWTSYPRGEFQAGFEALDRLRARVVRK